MSTPYPPQPDPYQQGPQPYPQQYAHPHQPPAPQRKPRPKGFWFAFPILLMVLGGALAVGAIVFFAQALTDTDGEAALDGQPHEIELSDTEERLVWYETDGPNPTCTFTDSDTGNQLESRPPGANYTRSVNGPEYSGGLVIVPESTSITVTCQEDSGSPVEIGKKPEAASVFGGFFAGLFGGIAVGAIGAIWLVVLLILFFTRPKRMT